MGHPFKKVQPGQKLEIPAEAFNTFIDAALDLKARQQSRGGQSEPRFPNSGIVKVRNASGSDRDRFDVLGLVAPIIDPLANLQAFKNEPTLIGVKPEDPTHRGKFAILLEPVKAGEIAHYACVSGVTPARVYVEKEWHDRADVFSGEPSCLKCGERGAATILWKQPGKGVKWAVVKIGVPYEEDFWARLLAVEQLSPNRWRYQFVEVVHSDVGEGYGSWVVKTGSRTGYAYNSVEDPNDGAGLEGNGVDIDRLSQCICGESSSDSGTPCCRLLPAGLGAIVRMKQVRFGTDAQARIEYWFQYENQYDCCLPTSSSSSSSSSSSGSSSSSSSGSSSSSSSGS